MLENTQIEAHREKKNRECAKKQKRYVGHCEEFYHMLACQKEKRDQKK